MTPPLMMQFPTDKNGGRQPNKYVLLDTDHLSLIQRNGQEGKQILTRLSTVANLGITVTVITYEEK